MHLFFLSVSGSHVLQVKLIALRGREAQETKGEITRGLSRDERSGEEDTEKYIWAIDKATHPRKFGYALDKKKEAQ